MSKNNSSQMTKRARDAKAENRPSAIAPKYKDKEGARALFGFHAVTVRLKVAPESVTEVYFDAERRDARMLQFLERARATGVRLVEADNQRLSKIAGHNKHQGVVAQAQVVVEQHSLDDCLDAVEAAGQSPLLLVLDGVTDPHNLGACLRTANGAGVHAVIAPKDRAVGVNATVSKVASGAAELVPYFMVTNLARTLDELRERGICCVGLGDEAPTSIYQTDLKQPLALVLGAEGHGLRQLTQKRCDVLVHIPMLGAVESLNVSVASAVVLYEALRQNLSV